MNRFGPLNSISSYPFENYLHQLKKSVRQGNNCLEQVANRILEKNHFTTHHTTRCSSFIPKVIRRGNLVECEIRQGLVISNVFQNAWILTKSRDIVKVVDISIDVNGHILLHGRALRKRFDFFRLPIRSSVLYIYAAQISNLNNKTTYEIDKVFCKYVVIAFRQNSFVYIPLLHTIQS